MAVNALVGTDIVDIIIVGKDTVKVGALVGYSVVPLRAQLVLPNASKQQPHTILAQSILILSLDTLHKEDGMVPINCVLLNNHKPVSNVSLANDDGTVPFN